MTFPTPGEVFPSVTVTTPISAGHSSSSSTEIEGKEAEELRRRAMASGQAAVNASADPSIQGYAIDPLTMTEIGKPPPTPVESPPVPVPADTPVPIGKFATIPAGQIPGMEKVGGGVIPAPVKEETPMVRLSQQKDANAIAEAKFAEQQAKGRLAEMARQEKIQNDAMAEWQKEMSGYKAEYNKARNAITNPEEKSVFLRVVQALAAGAGAYSASKLGGPNYAQQILDEADRQAMVKKKLELETAMERMKDAGARPEMIRKLYDTGLARVAAKQATELEAYRAGANKLLARFPEKQAEADRMFADRQAKLDAEHAAMAKDVGKRRVESGTSTPASMRTEVTPGTKDLQGGKSVSDAESKKANYGDQIVQAVKTIKTGPELSDSDLKRLNQNMIDMAAAAEQGTKGMTGAAKVQAMRALDLSPSSLTDGLPKEKKAVALAWLNATGLIIRDQSGAAITVPEDLRNWQVKGPQPGEGKDGYKRKLENVEYEGNNMLKMAGAEANRRLRGEVGAPTVSYAPTKEQTAKVPEPSRAPTGKELRALSKDELKDYQDAKRVKPGDPDYAGAQSAIRKLEEKARAK